MSMPGVFTVCMSALALQESEEFKNTASQDVHPMALDFPVTQPTEQCLSV